MRTHSRREFLARSLGTASLIGLAGWPAVGREPAEPAEMIGRAVAFLRPRQGTDGSWSGTREPGITALVVTALLRSGRVTPADPAIARSLAFLERYLGPKGGLSEAPHSVYTTSVALMAFHEANRGGRYDAILKGGQEFLKASQLDEGDGKKRDDPAYGGLGYGGPDSRPDLSNTAFMIEALRDTGLPADDPGLQKALIFVSRCQNLRSEFNDQPWAGKVNDGGFVYNPGAPGGETRGRTTRGAGGPAAQPAAALPRSNVGMTYAGLKSMIYAGLTRDDVRVKAALNYIKDHYTLDENPGQGQRGLYYYYHTFARAMSLLGSPTIIDAAGKAHDWRKELAAALARRQQDNGGWVNREDRFMEGDPNIVTSFALLALHAARPEKK